MTFSAVGSFVFNNTTGTLSLTPNTVGNLIVLFVTNNSNNTVTCTALSSTNATWTLVSHHAGTNASNDVAVYLGKVTSTSNATVTPTWSGTAPTSFEWNAHEFSVTSGVWAADQTANIDATSDVGAWPAPSAPAGELYYGWAGNNGTAAAGTTSGYTYTVPASGDGSAFNPSYSGTAPAWTDTNGVAGIVILVKEIVSTPAPSPAHPGRSWNRRFKHRQSFQVSPNPYPIMTAPATVSPITLQTSTGAGDAILVDCNVANNITSVVDSQGNTYLPYQADTVNKDFLFAATYNGFPGNPTKPLKAGVDTITVSGSSGGVFAFAGIRNAAPYPADKNPQFVRTTGSTTPTAPTTGTLTTANEVVIACANAGAVGTVSSWGQPFSSVMNVVGGGGAINIAAMFPSTTASVTPTVTLNASSSTDMFTVSFFLNPFVPVYPETFNGLPGRSWKRQYKHHQALPEPPGPVPQPPYAYPAAPGKAWQHRFKHRQQWQGPPPPTGVTSGPPLTPLSQPVRAQPRLLPPRGRVYGNPGNYDQLGPPFYQATQPITMARRAPGPFLKGQVIGFRFGIYDQVGPPVTPLQGPVSGPIGRRAPPPFLHGRAIGINHSGNYDGVGPPVKPLSQPVKAQPQFPFLHGRSRGNAGNYDGVGPPVKPLSSPVRARQPLPPRGRVYGNQGNYDGVGPPLKPLSGPVKAQPQSPFLHGRGRGSAGNYDGIGPPVKPLSGPVKAQPQSPFLHGRSRGNPGNYDGVGPPVKPLSQPVHTPFRQPPRGTVHSNPGSISPVVPPYTLPSAPGQTWRRRFRHPQKALGFGIPAVITSGPPVYPLQGPVGNAHRAPGPFRKGRAYGISQGVYDGSGPPVKPLSGPVTTPRRAAFSKGRAYGNSGVFDQSGPSVKPLSSPIKAKLPIPFLKGRSEGNIGVFDRLGPAVKPLSSPVTTPRRAAFSKGRAYSGNPGVRAQTGPPVYPLHRPVKAQPQYPYLHGRGGPAARGTFTLVVIVPNAGRPQPLPTRQPRRTAARAVWYFGIGPANAHGGNGTTQPRATVPIPRRYPSRLGFWHFITQPNFYNGRTQPRATVMLPRRTAARAVWRQRTGQAFPNGQVQPKATVAIPRRYPSRAVWRYVIGPANQHGPLGSRQPLATRLPRRTSARAVTRFVLGPANAHGPNGTAPFHRVVARRGPARAWVNHVLGRANAHGGNGAVQPKATVRIPRRAVARAVTRYVLGPANAHGPSGSLQPRATIPIPRRQSTRLRWIGTKPIATYLLASGVEIAFNVEALGNSNPLQIAFNVGQPIQTNERLLPGDPFLSHQVGYPIVPNQTWISPYDGIRKLPEDPKNYTQGGN